MCVGLCNVASRTASDYTGIFDLNVSSCFASTKFVTAQNALHFTIPEAFSQAEITAQIKNSLKYLGLQHCHILYIRDCESLCLSDETLKAVGPFYLVSMPVEVKYPTQGGNV